MGLFGSSSDDDGCTAHHYPDEWELDWDSVRTEEYPKKITFRVQRVKRCQHQGCNSRTHAPFRKEFHVPKKALLRMGKRAEALNDYLEAEVDVGELDEQ